MKNIRTIKSFTCVLLCISTLLSSSPLLATNSTKGSSITSPNGITISNAEHKKIIENFLVQITNFQNQVYSIAQATLTEPNSSERNKALESRIQIINNNIERLNKEIQDYLAIVPGVTARNRHVLLTFNYINLIKSNLYTLTLLINATNQADRINLLDEFFNTRITSLNTLDILEKSLAEFNT